MNQQWYNIGHRPIFKNFNPKEHRVRWGERKHNGHRYTLIKYPDGDLRAYGARAINTWANLPMHLQNLFGTMPDGTVFDGELVAPSDEASDVTHLLASSSPRLGFRVFAAPWLAGEDNRTIREAETIDLYSRIREYGFETVDTLPVEACTLQNALNQKLEGYVLKSQHYVGWYKYKPQQTADVFVTQALQGYTGKFVNCWGSLVCAVYRDGKPVTIANVGKGKDELWRKLPLGQIIGRVCEISHEGLQSQGKLKFSAFLRWRDDKEPEACSYDQFL